MFIMSYKPYFINKFTGNLIEIDIMNYIKNIFCIYLIIVWGSATAYGQQKMLLPDTLSGANINLELKDGTHEFYQGVKTKTMGANGNILGPTVILEKGKMVNMTVANKLSDTTTIHWHGLHVAAKNDGGPHTFILPNKTWTPSFKVLDDAATYWYHPHLHHKTDLHVSKGISGFIIVRDQAERALKLPRTYGVDDFPMVIQTKDFDTNKQIVHHSNSDDVVMVNATIDPFLDVPSQVVRYRLLNGSSQRVFNLGLSNNQKMHQIATDGGLLEKPIELTRLLLAPGERAEILIDFTEKQGQSVYLKSYASDIPSGIYGASSPGMGRGMTLTGYSPNALNGADFNIIEFKVGAIAVNPIKSIPKALVNLDPISTSSVNVTRNLTLSPETMGMNQLNGDFLINNRSFDLNSIDYTIPLNNVEIWSIRNNSGIAHPFHIHDVQFYLIDRNGTAVTGAEKGRKDVVLIKPMETVRFVTKFDDFADSTTPYMFHCHMLTHEDGGMMGQFVVVDNTSNSIPTTVGNGFSIYPNPSNGVFKLVSLPKLRSFATSVTSIDGKQVLGKTFYSNTNGTEIDISHQASGVYVLTVYNNQREFNYKLIKN